MHLRTTAQASYQAETRHPNWTKPPPSARRRSQVDAAIHLDDLVEKLEDISPSEFIAALFELEMLGLVKQLPGQELC